jgi:hypothetical protein
MAPSPAFAQFPYYHPLTARAEGMGGAATADRKDGANAWANPAVVADIDNVTLAACYSSYSIEPLDFTIQSAFSGVGYTSSNEQLRIGGALGAAYHRETIESNGPAQSQVEDTFHMFGGMSIASRILRFAVGVAAKTYSVPLLAGDQERAWLADVGALATWSLPELKEWSSDFSVGISQMNIGDPVLDPLAGPVDAITTRRLGTGLAVSSPTRSRRYLEIFGSTSSVAASVAFDVEEATDDDGHWRYSLGGEVSILQLIMVRGGYVHNDLQLRGARDATFGAGLQFMTSRFGGRLDYARWPNYHDVYSNVFGLSLFVGL